MTKRLRDDDDESRRFDVARLPIDVRTRELPASMTCERARLLALTGTEGGTIAARAKIACRALATLLEQSLLRIKEYADLYVAYVVRMLPNAWDRIGIASLDGGERFLQIAAGTAAILAMTGAPASVHLRLNRIAAPEVVDQLDVFRTWIRLYARPPRYRLAAPQLRLGAAAGGTTTGLTRVLDAMLSGGSGALVARLRDGSVRPEDLRAALARAVAFSATMNAMSTTGAAQLDVSALQRTEDADLDVDAIDRATGVDPASRRWIDNAARIVALRSPLRELTIGDVERLLSSQPT